ncbi:MAG: zf-HC2 domain-containing protein [Thermoplasmata archaeon]|nr:MAG: zf-HC2 domain-containing protein [Thermoplasmata archaeon]
MNNCKNISEKIMFFDDLGDMEQDAIKQHTEQCTACQQKLEAYQTIMVSLKQHLDDHVIDVELLERYSIYLAARDEPDYDGRKLTASEIAEIREHLSDCPRCQKKVDQLSLDYQDIVTCLEDTELASLTLADEAHRPSLSDQAAEFLRKATDALKDLFTLSTPRLYPIAVGAVAVLLILIWFGPFFRGSDNPYAHLMTFEHERIFSVTRGNLPQSLNQGIYNFQQGNYKQAILDLEQFIPENSNEILLSQAHLAAGIAYLHEAQSDFLGRFHKIDTNLVDSGIQHLRAVTDLTDNLRVKEDAFWFIGNAYLLKQDANQAKGAFEKVIEQNGQRFKSAQELIRELENIKERIK